MRIGDTTDLRIELIHLFLAVGAFLHKRRIVIDELAFLEDLLLQRYERIVIDRCVLAEIAEGSDRHDVFVEDFILLAQDIRQGITAGFVIGAVDLFERRIDDLDDIVGQLDLWNDGAFIDEGDFLVDSAHPAFRLGDVVADTQGIEFRILYP